MISLTHLIDHLVDNPLPFDGLDPSLVPYFTILVVSFYAYRLLNSHLKQYFEERSMNKKKGKKEDTSDIDHSDHIDDNDLMQFEKLFDVKITSIEKIFNNNIHVVDEKIKDINKSLEMINNKLNYLYYICPNFQNKKSIHNPFTKDKHETDHDANKEE